MTIITFILILLNIKTLIAMEKIPEPYLLSSQNSFINSSTFKSNYFLEEEFNSTKFDIWLKDGFLKGANIHPYKHFSPFSMRNPIRKKDLENLISFGANLVIANYPGVFDYFPPYEIDSLSLYNLDKIVQMTFELNLFLVISIRSGPGRSLYSMFNNKREDEYIFSDSLAKSKYIEMCKFIAKRYKSFDNLIGINFLLEPHGDDPVILEPISDSIYFNFLDELISGVREVNKELPIIVQPQGWAYPDKFKDFKKFSDSLIVYSFDMYFPHTFTNENNDSTYPGFYYLQDILVYVDSTFLEKFLNPVIEFKIKDKVPIFVNEYGGLNYKKGLLNYLNDLNDIFLKYGFHFAFYVWRSGWGEVDGRTIGDFDYQNNENSKNKPDYKNEIIEEFRRVWKFKK